MEIGEAIKSRFRSPMHKVVVNIRYTSNWLGARQQEYMDQFDLTMQQFNILRILRGAGEALNIHTVKERMVEKSPNTTRLMDKLIDKGLIERVRCEKDRRVVYVNITQKGLDILAKIDVDFDDEFLYINKLSNEEAENLSHLLDKLRS
ncbi:MAG: MarR family transcriptional regulator [Bacteroidetes bacterium]|nr:MAG: MarR family transcriptional regulator [Bacteroidota bacterium]